MFLYEMFPLIGRHMNLSRCYKTMDGFSLNINVSASAPRPTKKKVTKFRQNKKKAQLQRKNNNGGGGSNGGGDRAAKTLAPKTVTPVKTITKTPTDETIHTTAAAADRDDDAYSSEDEMDDTPAPSSSSSKPKVVSPVKAAAPVKPIATKVEPITKDKGTRRNPNKDGYSADSYLRPTLDMSKVVMHDAPLASKESKDIFSATTFDAMKLHAHLVGILTKSKDAGGFGFDQPTRVQVASVPAICAGGDVLLKSETGSGKTLSYCLPMVHRLMSRDVRVNRSEGCLAMVLAPTRELCMQIQETLERLLKVAVYIVAGSVVGGEKKKTEKARLRKGVSILVATPGRLIDHLTNTHSFTYNRLQFLILDEADRLLDLGFERSITQILDCLAAKQDDDVVRQSILVSATINAGVERLAALSLQSPRFIDADSAKGAADTYATPDQLIQHFMIVPAKQRLCALAGFLRAECRRNKRAKIVVFLSTCDAVDFVSTLFQKCTWPQSAAMFGPAVFRLHGNVNQQDRTATFQAFCKASAGILFCTDVAARGLNLPTVQWIVQYDPPTETKDYVHRVGRTARSGAVGNSLLFLLPSESAYCDHLKSLGLNVTALSLDSTLARSAFKGEFKASSKKAVHEVVVHELQYLFEQTVLANAELFEMACQAFQSFVRSYATHSSETRQYFHVRSLHFGHVAKSFALREPPASNKVTKASQQAKGGSLKKRKALQDVDDAIEQKKQKKVVQAKRKYNHHVSEFAE
ncbi:Aste57867_10543 [Aphanomyces stellatus]|uniref:ATP-dependent RNA helicase n=1 Tax=Aphanomyces stellatus TaxID=120398 RepID=A0A485KQM4_9STRA|nr:hypothetical protein As57867_010503 [Aphanomyces stellatus]VFT87416.1 Aste57867_10543 [Aphanomyces stellatus]